MNRRRFVQGLVGSILGFVALPLAAFRLSRQPSPQPTYQSHVKSVDELVAEYHAWVEGNYDDHDKVINSYKDRVLAGARLNVRAHSQKVKNMEAAVARWS